MPPGDARGGDVSAADRLGKSLRGVSKNSNLQFTMIDRLQKDRPHAMHVFTQEILIVRGTSDCYNRQVVTPSRDKTTFGRLGKSPSAIPTFISRAMSTAAERGAMLSSALCPATGIDVSRRLEISRRLRPSRSRFTGAG